MIHDIGDTAGKIWRQLAKDGPTPIRELCRDLGVEASVFNMAIGWLSREAKIGFERQGKAIVVRLEGSAEAQGRMEPSGGSGR